MSKKITAQNYSFAIKNIVGRVHCCDTNRQMIEYVVSRFKKGYWAKMPFRVRFGIIRIAIKSHQDNSNLFYKVTRGLL